MKSRLLSHGNKGVNSSWGHITECTKRAIANTECQLANIPAGLTPVVQPFYLTLNKLFKDRMAALYEYVEQDGKLQTLTGRVKQVPLSNEAQWMCKVWYGLAQRTVCGGYVKRTIGKCISFSPKCSL